MKKYYLLILLFIPLFSIAQSNYKSGYVVNLKGDTLRGYINFKEWSYNPESIDFKSILTNKSQQLSLADINYFEISSYVSYQRYHVSVSANPVDPGFAPTAIDTGSITSNVFLKILEKGKYITLYSYRDNLKERFYIKENGTGTPTELLYGIYQDPNKENSIIDKNTYQAQLLQVAEKYNVSSDKFIAQVQEARYKDYLLIPVVTQINGNKEENAAKLDKHSPYIRFFAGASLISSTLKFSNVIGESQYYGVSPSTSTSPKISIGVDAIANPDVGHLIFRLELGYTQDKFSVAQQPNALYNEVNPILSSEKYKMNVLFITPQVIYNIYNEAMLKVFVDAGYSINVFSYPNATIITSRSGEVLYTTQSRGLDSSIGNGPAITFKGGVVVSKRFEIYGAYFFGVSVTGSQAYNTNLSSYQVGVNYFIGKVAN